jgi:AcrR family transcriptional regulator
MPRKLTGTQRHKRELRVPAPGRKGNIKVPYHGWLECARVVLIEEGIGMVKVDRLAKRLKVTRGGFYYHFKSPHALLEALLKMWREQNIFIPAEPDAATPEAAYGTLAWMTDRLIHEQGFDPQFDMAIREWARISTPVAAVVREVDDERVRALRKVMIGLGCRPKEADIRAKVFYFHQIGYYTLGVEEDTRTREENLPVYLTVLCGESYLKAAHATGKPAPARAREMVAA